MSRFINQLPKMRGRTLNEGLATKIANKVRSAYSNFAHSSAYIPDKWALAWGKFAKELAKEVCDYVASDPKNASAGKIISQINVKSVQKKPAEESVEKPVQTVENIVVEDVDVDYDHYLGKVRELIGKLHEKRNEYIDALDKTRFKDMEFASKPEMEALYKILTDSFVPEQKKEEKPEPESANPEQANAKQKPAEHPAQQTNTDEKTPPPAATADNGSKQEQKKVKPKKQSFANVFDMIGSFKANYDKNGEVTNRVIQLMFDEAMKESGKADPAKVAKTALQGVGAANAARSVA